MTSRREGLAAACLASQAAVGCSHAEPTLSVCPTEVAAPRADEAASRTLPVDAWFALLVRDFDRKTMQASDPPRDCSGRPITVHAHAATEPSARTEGRSRRPRTADDLTVQETAEGDLLVWARLVTLADGDALGPVALARWVDRGLRIRAIGAVEAPPEHVQMRLEALGEGRTALVLESDDCTGDPPRPCSREAQLLLLRGIRLERPPLIVDGEDAGPARIQLDERHELDLADGRARRCELQRRLEFVDGQLIVHEQVQVAECDRTGAPDAACHTLFNGDERRRITLARDVLHERRPAAPSFALCAELRREGRP